jgi:serine protease Do
MQNPTWRLVPLVAALFTAPFATAAELPDPAVLAAEARRVETIRAAAATSVAIFAGDAGGGSGVLVSPTGYALTNFHVVQPAGPALRCGLNDGRLYDAVLVGLDPTGDVALVKLLGRDDFPAAVLADSDEVTVGDFCFAVGNPFLLATDLAPSVSAGIVSGIHRYQFPAGTILEYTDCLQVDAAINPGNSGGGLFDAAGRLIGVNGRASFEKRGRVNVGAGYAISANQLRNFLGVLRAGRLVDHATLGATVATAADGRVVVSDILESSDAWRRGLRYDDEIVALAGRPVRTVNAFKNVLGTLPAGWQVPLTVRRSGRRQDMLVRLASVHTPAALAALAAGPPRDTPDTPPDPEDRQPGNKPLPGGPQPKTPQFKIKRPSGGPPTPHSAPPQELPEVVRPLFEPRPGFTNFHFNVVERDRVARSIAESRAARTAAEPWEFAGTLAEGGPFRLVVTDTEAILDLPTGTSRLSTAGEFDQADEPAGSGGLLAAVVLWRRLVKEGPAGMGKTTYWGTAPERPESLAAPGVPRFVDVLESAVAGVTARFAVDDEGHVIGIELWQTADGDPCEVRLPAPPNTSVTGLPEHIEVRRGTDPFVMLRCSLESGGAVPAGTQRAGTQPAASAPARPLPATTSVQATIAAAARKVVKIYGAGGLRGLESYQSGIIVAPEGVIVTVAGSVLDTDTIDVVLDDGSRHAATLVGSDPRRELAVLTIEAEDLPAFDLAGGAAAAPAPVGTRVLALSNMFGVAVGDERVTAQRGVVAAVVPLEARRGAAEAAFTGTVYVLDCTTNNPGAPGGAVVDAAGGLVGMLGKELRATTSGAWLNYALPAAEVAQGRRDIVSGVTTTPGPPPQPFPARALGIVLLPDLLDRTPPFVDTVIPGSAAAAAGVRADDLVVAVAGGSVASRAVLERALGRLAAGDPVRLTLVRGGMIVEIDLGPRPVAEEEP